jgi:CubicO group peptidase (beta-lactamase class C family)
VWQIGLRSGRRSAPSLPALLSFFCYDWVVTRFDSDQIVRSLESRFRENFEKFGDLGAAVSFWKDGREIADLFGGFRDARREHPWTADTLVLFWSATKGLGSACLLHVLQEERIGLERRVAEFWPEFAQGGKEKTTLAQLLSHQAGVCALDAPADISDYDAVIQAIERQTPLWPPGTAHGYHARTFGFLLDELVRRLAHKTLADYWRSAFAEPLHLDIWIALPRAQNSRVATIYAPKAGRPAEPAAFYRDLSQPGTIAQRTFSSPEGLPSVSAMNDPAVRAQAFVSFSGIGSARSLAKFYGMLAHGGELEGKRFFGGETLRWMADPLVDDIDRVFQIPTAFSAGFMKDSRLAKTRIFGPSPASFGHPGAGGSHAFADPSANLGFAYVMNQMDATLLPNEKALRLVDALYVPA